MQKKNREFETNRTKPKIKRADQTSLTRLKNNQKTECLAESQTQRGLSGLRGLCGLSELSGLKGMRGLSGERTRRVRLPEYGRSMVEMLGVLAVIGMLSITAIWGYRYAMTMYRANETVHEINLRAYAIAPIADNNTTDPEEPEIVMEMGEYTNLGYPIRAYWLEDPKYFEIEVQNVPVDECKMILRTEWTLPIIMKVGDLAYDGNTSICDGLTEAGEPTTTAVMVFQYGAHLEDDMLPYQECHNDDDCASKCARCSAEGVCVSICGSNERCRQDILTGSQVCCTSDRWAGPYCCPSTMNGYCCNVSGDQCCPWFKPLIDKNGNCYTCEEENGVDVTGVNENCNACPNRELWNNRCVLPCGEKQIRGDNGKCYDCEYPNPIAMSDAVSRCTSTCSNRVANGNNKFCSIPCEEGTFTGYDGKCYSCYEEKNIGMGGVTHDGCERCSNRKLLGDQCVLMCPQGEIRGDDGKCYSCQENDPIYISGANLCERICSNRVASGWLNKQCIIPCEEGTFTGDDGKCYSCDEEKNIISAAGIDSRGCEQCPDTRNMYNGYCVPKCPADEPLRGADNKCYPCDTEERVNVQNITDACMECYEERKLDGNYCVLKE